MIAADRRIPFNVRTHTHTRTKCQPFGCVFGVCWPSHVNSRLDGIIHIHSVIAFRSSPSASRFVCPFNYLYIMADALKAIKCNGQPDVFVRCSQNLKKICCWREYWLREREKKKIRFDQLLSTRSSCDSNFEDDVNFSVIYLWKNEPPTYSMRIHSCSSVCRTFDFLSFHFAAVWFHSVDGRRAFLRVWISFRLIAHISRLSTVGWGIHVLHVLLILPFIHIAFEHLGRFEFPLDDENDFEMWMMDWDWDRDTPYVQHVQRPCVYSIIQCRNRIAQCSWLSCTNISLSLSSSLPMSIERM